MSVFITTLIQSTLCRTSAASSVCTALAAPAARVYRAMGPRSNMYGDIAQRFLTQLPHDSQQPSASPPKIKCVPPPAILCTSCVQPPGSAETHVAELQPICSSFTMSRLRSQVFWLVATTGSCSSQAHATCHVCQCCVVLSQITCCKGQWHITKHVKSVVTHGMLPRATLVHTGKWTWLCSCQDHSTG